MKWIDEVLEVTLQHAPVPLADDQVDKTADKAKTKTGKTAGKGKSVRTH